MFLLFYVLLFFLGAIMASFAGVILERGRGGFELERLPAILLGRSYCPGCKTKQSAGTLARWQLIPIFGRLIQGGKCYRCKGSIPSWYVWFEIIMGVLFVYVGRLITGGDMWSVFAGEPITWQLLFRLGIVWASFAIFVADIFWYELNVWLWFFLLIWLLVRGIVGYMPVVASLIWMFVFFVIFLGIYWFGRRYVKTIFNQEGEGFGQGDVMMAMIVGLLFPIIVTGLPIIAQAQMALLYLVVSSLIGMFAWYVRFLITGDRNALLPFLPAMMVGFVVVLQWGAWLVSWL